MGKIIGIVVVVVLVAGGWFWWSGRKVAEAPTESIGQSPLTAETPESVTPETAGIISSIKDAMGLGKKMQCTYSTEANGKTFQSNVIVDGTSFKTVSVMGDMTVYGLFDGADQYTWTSKDKQGFKMSKACMEELKKMAPAEVIPTKEKPQVEDLQEKFDMANNVSCTPATTADFNLPSDITFTDQCAMMKQSLEMMNQFKDKLPAGIQIPGMPSGN